MPSICIDCKRNKTVPDGCATDGGVLLSWNIFMHFSFAKMHKFTLRCPAFTIQKGLNLFRSYPLRRYCCSIGIGSVCRGSGRRDEILILRNMERKNFASSDTMCQWKPHSRQTRLRRTSLNFKINYFDSLQPTRKILQKHFKIEFDLAQHISFIALRNYRHTQQSRENISTRIESFKQHENMRLLTNRNENGITIFTVFVAHPSVAVTFNIFLVNHFE